MTELQKISYKIRPLRASYDRCGDCGAMLPDKAKKCYDCGALFNEQNKQVEITPVLSVQSPVFQARTCPQCGDPMSPKAKRCKRCNDEIKIVRLTEANRRACRTC